MCQVGGHAGEETWCELGKPSDAHPAWSDHAIEVHGITPEKVSDARDHRVVLQDFLAWAVASAKEQAVAAGRDPAAAKVALNCHNGAACDLDWLFHYQRRYNLVIPPEIEYYFDTLTIVKGSTAHAFNKAKYKGPVALEGLYSLGRLYEAMFREPYDGEHNAGADAKAGGRVIGHKVSLRRCSMCPFTVHLS